MIKLITRKVECSDYYLNKIKLMIKSLELVNKEAIEFVNKYYDRNIPDNEIFDLFKSLTSKYYQGNGIIDLTDFGIIVSGYQEIARRELRFLNLNKDVKYWIPGVSHVFSTLVDPVNGMYRWDFKYLGESFLIVESKYTPHLFKISINNGNLIFSYTDTTPDKINDLEFDDDELADVMMTKSEIKLYRTRNNTTRAIIPVTDTRSIIEKLRHYYSSFHSQSRFLNRCYQTIQRFNKTGKMDLATNNRNSIIKSIQKANGFNELYNKMKGHGDTGVIDPPRDRYNLFNTTELDLIWEYCKWKNDSGIKEGHGPLELSILNSQIIFFHCKFLTQDTIFIPRIGVIKFKPISPLVFNSFSIYSGRYFINSQNNSHYLVLTLIDNPDNNTRIEYGYYVKKYPNDIELYSDYPKYIGSKSSKRPIFFDTRKR